MDELQKRPLFNPGGDIDVTHRRLIGGNTTNMNDFNELKYAWASDWYVVPRFLGLRAKRQSAECLGLYHGQ